MHALLLTLQAGATIVGTVREERSQRPAVGIVVTLVNARRTMVTTEQGEYRFADVPAGPQRLDFRGANHVARTLQAIVPPSGTLTIDVTLRRIAVQLAEIMVRAPVPVRGAEGPHDVGLSQVDRSASVAALRNHPLLAEADALAVLNGGEVAMAPEAPGGLHVRGGATDEVAFLLDGIPTFSPYHGVSLGGGWNPDLLAQVSLSTRLSAGPASDVLGGIVEGRTRSPTALLSTQGSLSTTQGRIALEGPLGGAGAGFLAAARSGFPGSLGTPSDVAFVRGGGHDLFGKLEAPLAGGRFRVLGFHGADDTRAVATIEVDSTAPPRFHRFAWRSLSLGARWDGSRRGTDLSAIAWRATSGADIDWAARAPLVLASRRRDLGLTVNAARGGEKARTDVGLRIGATATRYRVAGSTGTLLALPESSVGQLAASAQHRRTVGPSVIVRLGAVGTRAAARWRLSSAGEVEWRPSARWTMLGQVSRRHQFHQSLGNPESVVSTVFPAELPAAADGQVIPIARSDQAVVGVEYRQGAIRLGWQGYVRRLTGRSLVALGESEPFAAAPVGSDLARMYGGSVEFAAATDRWGLVASVGIERVRLGGGAAQFTPMHAPARRFDLGITAMPSSSLSLRLGAAVASGRRGTVVNDGFEWESCNLADRGCEFRGSPVLDLTTLGRVVLPDYLRVDLSVRKRWTASIAGRDGQIGLFGTISNLGGRSNVLTYTRQPGTDRLEPVLMRPLAPLLFGLDWRF